jgi:RNA polymerase sigma factor (sigma-70 family)
MPGPLKRGRTQVAEQNNVTKLYAVLVNVRKHRNARAWLLTIVRRSAYSWLEKNRMRAQVAVDDLSPGERAFVERGGECDPLHTATAETELIAKADAARLETAISALPLEFREVFVLREIEGLDYRAIAEVTAMPLGTVMSRLARARRRLTDTLGARQ